MPGPLKTPTAILKARGSEIPKYDRGDEPMPDPKPPRCPAWLRTRAKACWKDIVPQLVAMGVFGRIDKNAVARYCENYARWRDAIEWLQNHDPVCTGRDAQGNMVYKAHPNVGIADRLNETLLKLEKNFGMTPSARASLAMPKEKDPHENRGRSTPFVARRAPMEA